MSFIPEWAPNVHPMIVHFPIALLFLAVLFDLGTLIFRDVKWLRNTAVSLYILGALATVVTYFTGKQAADVVTVPALANPVLNEHADWAQYTVWFFGIYGLTRLLALWGIKYLPKIIPSVLFFLIAVGGIGLLYETAEHGAELVFRYGVGVQAIKNLENVTVRPGEQFVPSAAGIVEVENGSWEWDPGQNAELILREQFNWVQGEMAAINPSAINDTAFGTVLAMNLQNGMAFLTAGRVLKSIQVDVELNTDEFSGEFMLVHHFQDTLKYDFLSLKNGIMKLGREQHAKVKIMEEGNFRWSGWIDLRMVIDGRHFRGYIDDKLVIHGHGEELPPGPVGFRIQGLGKILMNKIKIQSLS